jgi:hypothetical protein
MAYGANVFCFLSSLPLLNPPCAKKFICIRFLHIILVIYKSVSILFLSFHSVDFKLAMDYIPLHIMCTWTCVYIYTIQ